MLSDTSIDSAGGALKDAVSISAFQCIRPDNLRETMKDILCTMKKANVCFCLFR